MDVYGCLRVLSGRFWRSCLLFLMVVVIPATAGTLHSRSETPSGAAASSEPSVDCASQPVIRLGGLDWESGQITTALLELLARDGLGCRTEVVPGSVPTLESALIQNDIQVIAEQWVGRSSGIDKAVKERKIVVIGDTLAGGATQGWYVPDYVQAEHPDLKTVDDLARHAKLFPNPEQPGQARFLNCPAGWVCEGFNTRLLKNTGLSAQYANVHPGTGAALDAEIASAIARHEPLLFYYWHPAGLMAKYHMVPIAFPPYDADCWPELLKPDSTSRCVSGFPVSRLAMAVSAPFAQHYPQLVALIKKLRFPASVLDRQILEMAEHHRSGTQQAEQFLKEHPELWSTWLDPQVALRLARQRGIDPARLASRQGTTSSVKSSAENTKSREALVNPEEHPDTPASIGSGHGFFPSWSVADWLNNSLARLVEHHGESFRAFSQQLMQGLMLPLEQLLVAIPPWLLLLVLAALVWHASRSLWPAIFSTVGFYLIGSLGLWLPLLQTLALLIAAFFFIVLLGFPLGILMAGSKRLHRWFSPVLDVVQTMPSFVYLIPVLMLFGIGRVPALFATVVYAMAPLIRLTALGIREVDARMVESAESFGCTRGQLLRWVLLPQARASILAGVNQAVMMSLGMVVVASMIGARGLGEDVLQSIQTLNIGRGVQAGVAIVILAIVIDRITQAYGEKRKIR